MDRRHPVTDRGRGPHRRGQPRTPAAPLVSGFSESADTESPEPHPSAKAPAGDIGTLVVIGSAAGILTRNLGGRHSLVGYGVAALVMAFALYRSKLTDRALSSTDPVLTRRANDGYNDPDQANDDRVRRLTGGVRGRSFRGRRCF